MSGGETGLDPNLERRITEIESRSRGNARRLDKLEELTETINRLAISVERMATKQSDMADSMTKLDGKVTAIESRPARRWETVADKVITAVAAAIVGFVLARLGLA